MTGFNPSYLSRFYRINTGKKLSDQIDEAKLQHAKKLIAQGELVKKCGRTYRFCLAVGVHPVLQTQHWGNAEAVF